jgi:hypothetical protein
VEALIRNLAIAAPEPVYFTGHLTRSGSADQVTITPNAASVFYIAKQFLTISIPMRPRTVAAQPARGRRRSR